MIPDEIEALEREQAEIAARMSAQDYHLREPQQMRADRKRIDEIQAQVRALGGARERAERVRMTDTPARTRSGRPVAIASLISRRTSFRARGRGCDAGDGGFGERQTLDRGE